MTTLDKIEALLVESGLTEKKFLAALGLNSRLLLQWRKGKSQPLESHLQRIRDAYALPVDYFEDRPEPRLAAAQREAPAEPEPARVEWEETPPKPYPLMAQPTAPTVPAAGKRAVAYVDFEHWCYGLQRGYRMAPNIGEWVRDITTRASVEEILFFGDFTEPRLQKEIPNIRAYSNKLIDTQNPDPHYKKDFSDFIIIDHIYQKAITAPHIDTIFLFTGDGHFNSVVSFLKNYCRKEVGVYGIKDAMSASLKKTASWYVELPAQADRYAGYYRMILDNLHYLRTEKPHMRPTFLKTCEVVAEQNEVEEELIRSALRLLMEQGYVYSNAERLPGGFHEQINVLEVDWDRVREDNLWESSTGTKEFMIVE